MIRSDWKNGKYHMSAFHIKSHKSFIYTHWKRHWIYKKSDVLRPEIVKVFILKKLFTEKCLSDDSNGLIVYNCTVTLNQAFIQQTISFFILSKKTFSLWNLIVENIFALKQNWNIHYKMFTVKNICSKMVLKNMLKANNTS